VHRARAPFLHRSSDMRQLHTTDPAKQSVAANVRGADLSGLGRVVACVDFSEGGRLAALRASQLPFAPGGSLELLHVVSHGESLVWAGQQIDEERDDLVDAGHLDAELIHASVAYGPTASTIVDRARRARAELIVLGRHGAIRVGDRFLGTTAERVVANGSASVLLVATPPTGPYRRPLVAVDLSDASCAAVALALRLSKAGHVDVVQVVAGIDAIEQARAALGAFLAGIDPAITWRATVEVGDPATVILQTAKRQGAELIALGTRGLGRIQRWLVGSVAEAVMRRATVDVLVTR
jgi:nucleotide-binding universal stress UspA family protein